MLHLHDLTSAAALLAALHIFSSLALAVLAQDSLLVVQLDQLAGVDVFQRHLDFLLGGSHLPLLLLSSSRSASVAEYVEEVSEASHSTTAILNSFKSILVIELSLF